MIQWQRQHEPSQPCTAAVYEELRAIARGLMRTERPGHTLQPTALVNEALLRLGAQHAGQNDSRQLRALSRLMMRRVLANHARDRVAEKRGGGAVRARLDPDQIPAPDTQPRRLALALEALERTDPRAATLVRLHHIEGIPLAHAAARLDLSGRTASRVLSNARAVLRDALGITPDPKPEPRPDPGGGR